MYENSDTIELAVHTSCYCVLDLLCVNQTKMSAIQMILVIGCWGNWILCVYFIICFPFFSFE